MNKRTDRPKWILDEDSILSMIIGGAFLGGLLVPGFLGAIVGAIFGAIIGWLSSKSKPDA